MCSGLEHYIKPGGLVPHERGSLFPDFHTMRRLWNGTQRASFIHEPDRRFFPINLREGTWRPITLDRPTVFHEPGDKLRLRCGNKRLSACIENVFFFTS